MGKPNDNPQPITAPSALRAFRRLAFGNRFAVRKPAQR